MSASFTKAVKRFEELELPNEGELSKLALRGSNQWCSFYPRAILSIPHFTVLQRLSVHL
jgi:hypothetical protein